MNQTTNDQALGVPGYSFDWKGQTYTIGPITQEVKAEFEKWHKQTALNGVFQLRGMVPTDDFTRMLAQVGRDIDIGKFQFGKSASTIEMNSETGRLVLLRLMLRRPDLTIDALTEMTNDEQTNHVIAVLITRMIEESQPRTVEGDSPKA